VVTWPAVRGLGVET